MSAEENRALYRRYIEEVFNKKNLPFIDENFAPDWVNHHGPTGSETLEEFKQRMTKTFATFPDLHFTVEDVVAEGDKVAARWIHQDPQVISLKIFVEVTFIILYIIHIIG